jgi:anti-sigma factor RsiW
MMDITMTPEERDRLIQRYFDGETLGDEVAHAERLLDEDPAAAEQLATLRTLSNSIKIDVAGALAEEDFSEYWANISERLEDEAVAVTEATDSIIAESSKPLAGPPSVFERLFGWAGLAAAAGAAALIAVGILTRGGPLIDPAPGLLATVDHTIVVEEIESPGSLVMVQQGSSAEPAIIWIIESDEVQEG